MYADEILGQKKETELHKRITQNSSCYKNKASIQIYIPKCVSFWKFSYMFSKKIMSFASWE